MNIFTLLLVFQIIYAFELSYDEDISLPVPQVILTHSPINQPAPQFLTRINNCECREHPKVYITCYGRPCKEFPSKLNVTAPLFKMKLSSITVLKKGDLELFTQVRVLEIESNYQLHHIESGFFHNMIYLTNLTIAINEKLNYLDEDVFEGLVSLSTLSLIKNGFIKVIDITKSLAPKYIPRLNLLEINENVFKKIEYFEFHPMNGTYLEQLNMILCEIEYIHPDSLAPLTHLSSLRVGQNHLNSTILTKLIERCTELNIPLDNLNLYGLGFRKKPPQDLMTAIGKSRVRFVHLIENHFDQLDNDSFPEMPNVVQMSLRGNHIMDIALDTFITLPCLRSLLLTVNRLTEIPQGALIGTLTELDLAGNNYRLHYPSYFYIPDEIFINMSRLQRLQLAYNNICYLTNYTFVGLNNLINLNLKNTSLTSIEIGTFSPLKNLRLLNLINNEFSKYMVLTPDLFQGLENLQVLLLGGCSLQSIPSDLFQNVPNLIHLGLERNELVTLPSQLFFPLINLKSLDISENILSSWNKRIIHKNFNLIYLSASQNKFSYISDTMLNDWVRLETIYLDGNPLTCDCSLYSVIIWYRNNKIKLKYFNEENFIASCVSPSIWRHKSIVSFLLSLNSNNNECENTGLNEIILIIPTVFGCLLFILGILIYIYRYYLHYLLFILILHCKSSNRESANYQWDVFVSYCSADEWFVLELVTMLEPQLRLCLRERDLDVGALQSEAITMAMASSRRLLLIVSEEYAKSSWCYWETQLAAQHRPLLVLLQALTDKHVPPLLRYFLRTRIYLRWPQEEQARTLFWQKLRSALAVQ